MTQPTQVRSLDDPSVFGQGVSPVSFAPAGTGAALGGPAAAVVVVAAEFFLDPPELRDTSRATIATMATMAPPTLRNRRRLAARVAASWA